MAFQMADQADHLLSDELRQSCRKSGAALFDKLVGDSAPLPKERPFMTQVMDVQADALRRFWAGVADNPEIAAVWHRKLMEVFSTPLTEESPDTKTAPPDRRFSDEFWNSHRGFRHLRRTYDRLSEGMAEIAELLASDNAVEGVRGRFLTRLSAEALCPANSLFTNPAALRHLVETDGESFVRSIGNLVERLDVETGRLVAPMSPAGAFMPGRDIAVTPGYVIAENALCQLLVYEPENGPTNALPVMIVPPWINKFYILDLRPQNSLIRWLTEQGHTVCVLSWVNPDAGLAETDFEDYMLAGPVEMGRRLCELLEVPAYHAVGYCLGGTLLAATAAWYAAEGEKGPSSYSFLTTLLDFSEPGDIGAFISPDVLALIDEHMASAGFLDGREMADVFSFLRSKDLYWSFFIEHFLMGRDPRPFDILHWNADNTRMPAAMHSYYLRNMYEGNRLVLPGALCLAGRSIDLGQINRPTFFLATEDDHIAPWQSVWRGAGNVGGTPQFVLAGSGHVAGVINSPGQKKYGFRDLTSALSDAVPAEQLPVDAPREEGSWWPGWKRFLDAAGNAETDSVPVSPMRCFIEPAPGRYVLENQT
tara:strand:+ start:42803 stop:44578 length:1776 start_codon:yes stop_codon:yes gene_type:complete